MSTISGFKAELAAAIAGAAPALQVIYGPIGAAPTTGPDILVVGNVTGTQDISSLDGSLYRESYDVHLTVSCSRPGPDSQVTATNAAFGFRDVVDTLLRFYVPTTPGALSAEVSGAFELIEDDTPTSATQRNAALMFTVHVEGSA